MELTDEQLEQQDLVDSEIFMLVQRLCPPGLEPGTWEAEWIAKVREAVQDVVCELTGMTEMQFYPYLEDE